MSDVSTAMAAQRRPAQAAAVEMLVALAAVVLAAAASAAALGLGGFYVAKAAAAFALGAGLVLAYLPARLARCPLGAANRVTLLRLALVALLAALLGEPGAGIAGWQPVALAALACALDGLDGWLARRLGLASRFGARFDMETDAALIAVLALLAWQLDKAGAWVVLSGLMRYLFVAAARLRPALGAELPASRRRQAVCVLQVVTLLACLAPVLESPWSDAIAGVGLALLVWSFQLDVRWLLRNAPARPVPR